MKKYKHKITGIIGEVNDGHWLELKRYPGGSEELISMDLVRGSKDWEEIIQKDYEILTITASDFNLVYQPLKEIRKYKDNLNYCWQIHSIKRLSDGEVFTLGDYVEDFNECITEISLDDNSEDAVRFTPWLVLGEEGGVHIMSAEKKVEKPLFTTEDGVDIFEGDSYYNVYDFRVCGKLKAINPLSKHEKLVFSTKEAAEEYILMNKLDLSINDVFKCIPNLSYRLKEVIINYVKYKDEVHKDK